MGVDQQGINQRKCDTMINTAVPPTDWYHYHSKFCDIFSEMYAIKLEISSSGWYLDSTVIWWMAVSWTIMPNLQVLYICQVNLYQTGKITYVLINHDTFTKDITEKNSFFKMLFHL